MSRIHLALGVDDVEAATAFSGRLFGVEPAGTCPGYANSATADPPLELVLLEEPGQGGTLDHLGVEVGSVDEVDAEQVRLAALDLASTGERDSTCCYAQRTGFWVEHAPVQCAGRSTPCSPTAPPPPATPLRRQPVTATPP